MFDILKQQSNISRSLTASGRSVYEYNGVNSYCMFHFIYRLNIFGGKAAREKMQNGGFGGHRYGGHGRKDDGGRAQTFLTFRFFLTFALHLTDCELCSIGILLPGRLL